LKLLFDQNLAPSLVRPLADDGSRGVGEPDRSASVNGTSAGGRPSIVETIARRRGAGGGGGRPGDGATRARRGAAVSATGELTLRYLSPTPIHTRLAVTARFDRQEGRRIYTSGEIRAGSRVTCRAEGLFIAIGAEKFEDLQRRRDGGE